MIIAKIVRQWVDDGPDAHTPWPETDLVVRGPRPVSAVFSDRDAALSRYRVEMNFNRDAEHGSLDVWKADELVDYVVPDQGFKLDGPAFHIEDASIYMVFGSHGFFDGNRVYAIQEAIVGVGYVHAATSGGGSGNLPAGACVPPRNLPFFRPNNTVTRGQVAKMITLTTGIAGDTDQHFEDVPPGSTFFDFINALYAKGVGGYNCTPPQP